MMKMTPEEKALDLCQKIGMTTMFADCNEGMTLPLEVSKQIALICVFEIEPFEVDYWNDVVIEIKKLKI